MLEDVRVRDGIDEPPHAEIPEEKIVFADQPGMFQSTDRILVAVF